MYGLSKEQVASRLDAPYVAGFFMARGRVQINDSDGSVQCRIVKSGCPELLQAIGQYFCHGQATLVKPNELRIHDQHIKPFLTAIVPFLQFDPQRQLQFELTLKYLEIMESYSNDQPKPENVTKQLKALKDQVAKCLE